MSRLALIPQSTPAKRADLCRAAEYRAGRQLCDDEVRRMLDDEWDALVERWAALGQWIARLEEQDLAPLRPVLVAAPVVVRRARPLGQKSLWFTPERKARQSAALRASWARRKALQKEA